MSAKEIIFDEKARQAILSGRLEATQIVALDPHVSAISSLESSYSSTPTY